MKNIKILLTLLFIGTGISANAQKAVWDSTFRPATYSIKIDQFNSYKSSAKDIIFLGNSIMANTDWSELLHSSKVKNRGISGDITFGILERLKDITDTKPAKIFLLIGIINEAIRKMADNKMIHVIDLYPHFLDENKRMKAELTHDGLHLTAAGYQVWAKILQDGKYLK